MKILFVISSLRGGGAERVASTLCNHWAELGHEVILVTLDGTESDFYKCNADISRYALDSYTSSKNILQKVYANARRLFKIAKIVRNTKPDIVVAFMDVSNVLATVACLGTKVPVVISERSYPPYFHDNDMFDRIRKFVYRFSHAFVAQTEMVASWGRDFYKRRIEIIVNPISNKALYNGTPVVPENIILGMGRLHPDKGFDLLVDAFSLCCDDIPEWQLHIAGHGPEHNRIMQQIQRLNLTHRIVLLGETPEPAKCYAKAKLFVLSSRVEGFPNVLIEAMANGLAVASFDCDSGPKDIIKNDVDGVLVKAMDVPALANTIKVLVNDQQKREQLSKSAALVRHKYILENISQQWLDLFKEVIDARNIR